jgi:hypothetical protein
MGDKREDRSTRRAVLQIGVAAFATGLSARAQAQEKLAQEKLAQKIVQYQEQPKNGQMCSTCVNFEAPNACKIVAGTIVPNGWCIAFAPKSG